ncbi:MAG TPA: methylated-DNA--[protein]-cysteine S-methyltransferase [Sulfurovum sp.]|jgi:methylated-DNA-[protein]-cysteine S-methyltransferase|nr:methylated-DNA--[protein]-cysteine S-methyltransferase [Sulfurovum sp.]HQS72846.1 methylated-DNA--[protein]-cysteine S-methyltransferase [Sulfurovum sp.]HQS78089.1 methylated-DNA--[protein]-cysteine S-methyltransferase [Sulfurovum sp.]HQT28831.1 methylated-DNA--[protein]-cysteine S-methyltransferase [Sulfurovum sp.]
MIAVDYYTSPAGELILGSYEERLCLADWRDRKARSSVDARLQRGLHSTYVEQKSVVTQKAKEQLELYFRGELQHFDLPYLCVGTVFQKQVWDALGDISYGDTASYVSLAKAIGNEKAVRAVASAVGANALSLFIPCHRIIGSNGTLTGYAGGLEAKKMLLDLETHEN